MSGDLNIFFDKMQKVEIVNCFLLLNCQTIKIEVKKKKKPKTETWIYYSLSITLSQGL